MRLIDAEALKEIIKERRTNIEKNHGIEVRFAIGMLIACETIIDKQPTIEAKPVVHAHWENEHYNRYGHLCHCCSNCGFSASHKDKNWCANCGAQMDELFPQALENGNHIAEAGKKESDQSRR